MGVSFPSVTSQRLDVGAAEAKACFVLVCLCCYNLGRFNHRTMVTVVEETGLPVSLAYVCCTCGATMELPHQGTATP